MEFSREEIAKNVSDWLAALRSGKYRQQRHANLENESGFCCFGVVCRVVNKNHKNMIPVDNAGSVVVFDGHSAALPEVATRALGLASSFGNFDDDCLSTLNDTGSTFAEIADIIESKPPGLFRD